MRNTSGPRQPRNAFRARREAVDLKGHRRVRPTQEMDAVASSQGSAAESRGVPQTVRRSVGLAMSVASLVVFAQQASASTDYTPAIIAAVVAFVGIVVAAWTAQKRQRAQLDHDRELHDLGELRTVVDEAAGITYTALDKLTDAMVAGEDW